MEQKYIDAAKKYWREKGYDQGAIKSIAELLERIEQLEERLNDSKWDKEFSEK